MSLLCMEVGCNRSISLKRRISTALATRNHFRSHHPTLVYACPLCLKKHLLHGFPGSVEAMCHNLAVHPKDVVPEASNQDFPKRAVELLKQCDSEITEERCRSLIRNIMKIRLEAQKEAAQLLLSRIQTLEASQNLPAAPAPAPNPLPAPLGIQIPFVYPRPRIFRPKDPVPEFAHCTPVLTFVPTSHFPNPPQKPAQPIIHVHYDCIQCTEKTAPRGGFLCQNCSLKDDPKLCCTKNCYNLHWIATHQKKV